MKYPCFGVVEEGRGTTEQVLCVSIKNEDCLDNETFKAAVRAQGERDFPPECRIKYRFFTRYYKIVRAEIVFIDKPDNVSVTAL